MVKLCVDDVLCVIIDESLKISDPSYDCNNDVVVGWEWVRLSCAPPLSGGFKGLPPQKSQSSTRLLFVHPRPGV